uniref:Uncharacterized protein n=1 Tax=Meloidogyne floridensis TaxID=298350 RepID=A0A915PE09_9BILA
MRDSEYYGHLTKLEFNLNLEGNVESYVNICINFLEEGNYYILIFNYFKTDKAINYFTKIEGEKEKCFNKVFKDLSKEELNILGLFKEMIQIYASKINEITDSENVIFGDRISQENWKIPKINFFSGDEQKWFFVDEKYFKMNKYGISEQIIEEGTSSDINNSNRAKMWKQALKLIQDDNIHCPKTEPAEPQPAQILPTIPEEVSQIPQPLDNLPTMDELDDFFQSLDASVTGIPTD